MTTAEPLDAPGAPHDVPGAPGTPDQPAAPDHPAAPGSVAPEPAARPSRLRWALPAPADDAELSAEPDAPGHLSTALMSLHFLRAAVRRRRLAVVLSALAGMLLGAAYLQVAPASHTAAGTVLLSHPDGADPGRAMATDLSLVTSRAVAEQADAALGSPIAPEALLHSVWTSPTTSDVLGLNLSAPSDAEAERRLGAFMAAYLDFRGKQVSAQADFLVQGYTTRIKSLQSQVAELDSRIAGLSAGAGGGTDQLTSAVSQRAQLNDQVQGLQQSVQEVTLRRSAVIAASRVIDPPAAVPQHGRLRTALSVASGLIGGTAVALALVVLQAVASDRLRLRVEVGAALGAPVRLSVGPLAPPPLRQRLLGFLPGPARRRRRRAADLARVGQAVREALPAGARERRVVVGCVDNAAEVAFGVGAAAVALCRLGRRVHLVDLSADGRLERAVAALTPPGADRPVVSRPPDAAGPPDAADPPDAGGAADDADPPDDAAWLVLADLDPAIGADHLAAWAPRILVAVTSGRSGVERVRTIGDLVRAARLDLVGGVLVRAAADDDSCGLPLPAADGPEGSA